MDGHPEDLTAEPTEATEPIEPIELTEPPEPTESEAGVRLTAEQLEDYLARASFATTRGRRGYQQAEVDAFLTKVSEAVADGQPLAELVRRNRFTTVLLEDGYDAAQVDDFLAAVVDLDPHAALRPEVGRSGLIAKLFG